MAATSGAEEGTGRQTGSWIGAAVAALGLGASLAIVTLGGTAIMDEGGFVASGGPYQIAHPVPEGFWLFPVGFIGCFLFPIVHAAFASRIRGFGLVFFTWCAIWTAVGLTTLWYGFDPPGGGFSWGWFIMGTVFSIVGLGSFWLLADAIRKKRLGPSEMPKSQRVPYLAMVASCLALGVAAGFIVFDAVVGL